jgi:hypothetical protein
LLQHCNRWGGGGGIVANHGHTVALTFCSIVMGGAGGWWQKGRNIKKQIQGTAARMLRVRGAAVKHSVPHVVARPSTLYPGGVGVWGEVFHALGAMNIFGEVLHALGAINIVPGERGIGRDPFSSGP